MRSLFRKISPALWGAPSQPVILGRIDVDLTLFEQRGALPPGRSPLPVICFLLHRALSLQPEMKQLLVRRTQWRRREWSFVLPIDSDVRDLRFVRLAPAPAWRLDDFRRALGESSLDLRARGERQLGLSLQGLRWIPAPLMPAALGLLSLLIYDLGVPVRWLGFAAEHFGPVIVSNFGSLGLDEAYSPLVPLCRNIMSVGVGRVREMVFAIQGQPTVRRGLTLTFTIDHRYLDGTHCAHFLRLFREEAARLTQESA